MTAKKIVGFLIFLSVYIPNAICQVKGAPVKVRPTQAERRPNVLAHLLRGPYLQTVTSSSIIIRWRTDVLTRSIVHFGEAADNYALTGY